MRTQPNTETYGGRISCGHPTCCPNPDLIRRLDNHAELLAALKSLLREADLQAEQAARGELMALVGRMAEPRERARAAIEKGAGK